MTDLIKSVKLSLKKTNIKFENKTVDKETQTTREAKRAIKSSAERHPDFNEAANEIASFIPAMLGFPEEYEVDFEALDIHRTNGFSVDITVFVRFNQEDITTGSPLTLGPLHSDSKNGKDLLSPQLFQVIEKFLVESEAYADRNKKAQFSLPIDEVKSDADLDEEEKRSISTPPGTRKTKTKKSPFRKDVLRAVASASA